MGEGEHQQENGERIEQDSERESARDIFRPVETPAADVWQQRGVEGERAGGERRLLPAVQHPQQQREQTRRDVHPLARSLGVRDAWGGHAG